MAMTASVVPIRIDMASHPQREVRKQEQKK
jgi:hypothetical protein